MRGDTRKRRHRAVQMGAVHRGGVPLNRPARREQIITGTGTSKILRTHLLGEVTTKKVAHGAHGGGSQERRTAEPTCEKGAIVTGRNQ